MGEDLPQRTEFEESSQRIPVPQKVFMIQIKNASPEFYICREGGVVEAFKVGTNLIDYKVLSLEEYASSLEKYLLGVTQENRGITIHRGVK